MKRIGIAVAALVVVLLILSGIVFFSIPRSQITVLKSGFVKTDVSKEGVPTYTIVPKKPKGWIELKTLPKNVWGAILVSEDWAFFEHSGVDVSQVKEAIEDTLEHGKGLRGASTISQQVAKNLFLSNERSFIRKAREFAITLYMEREIEKKKILEIYLNIIEYGAGLYGLESAARFYFKKSAHDLNAREAAFIAMLLPNPKGYSQSFRDGELSEYASKTVESILDKMRMAGFLTKEERDALRGEPLSFEKKKIEAMKEANAQKAPRSRGQDGKLRYKAPKDGDMAVDPDLALPDVPEFDPNDRLENLDDVDEEFRVE